MFHNNKTSSEVHSTDSSQTHTVSYLVLPKHKPATAPLYKYAVAALDSNTFTDLHLQNTAIDENVLLKKQNHKKLPTIPETMWF